MLNYYKLNNLTTGNFATKLAMRKVYIIISILLLTSFQKKEDVLIDKAEGIEAFWFLTSIRNNPEKYQEELQYPKEIKVSRIQLKWNDTLAKVAESKAFDMANRNYYGHVDPDGYGINFFINKSGYKLDSNWLKSPDVNYFESITANNQNGTQAIKNLIIDKNTPSLGHRKHLLGLDTWNSSLIDIGIGFSRREIGSTYQTYTCVIIAKHNY